ncbi:MAG: UDP-N-acetylmuramoylalanine--D-glutamate ligase [Candidatus Binatota bacterium]|jgi:UDP-N-acetylmuramoylalanine--D-glutamate ligase|nr:UDP-N-acetylmuramoylalanine--D-glutamate ligase [Candidatus Binatota bacterium]
MSILLAGRHFLVIGAKRTGMATARFLAVEGARVRLADQEAGGFDAERRALATLAVEWRLGGGGEELLDGIDAVVPSPGVPPTGALLTAAKRRGIPILSEIELASRFLSVPIHAITGTNGKSTTTELVGDMLRRAGLRTFVGGNLGTPLVEAVGRPLDAAVVEVSSFQLEWTEQFRPAVAAFLNLTDDHLDRYASREEYGEAKTRLFARQTAEDWAVLSREDPWVWERRHGVRSRVVSFGFDPVELGAFVRDDRVIVRLPDGGNGEETFSLERTRLSGLHNLENVMAAALVARLAGAPAAAVQETIDAFPGLPHRLELVREKDGVRWVDDSKGTNVGAVVKSLASIRGPVILLAGGVEKGGSYDPLRPLVRDRVKRLVLFGEARQTLLQELGHDTDAVIAVDLEDAVRCAAEVARAGDTVLLSPACASFDMFRDYAERGERFRALVEAL